MHREGQGLSLLLPRELRADAACPRERGSGRPHVREALGDRPRLLAPALRHVRGDRRDRRRRRVVRHQAQVREVADHLPRPLRRPAGGDRRQPAQAAGRDSGQRLRRQGGALYQPLRRLQHPARLPPGRPRLHGRREGRARRDHPPRREDALRGQPRHRSEGDGHRPQGLRGGLLRDVRQGVRARPDRRLARRRDLGDGGRGGGRNHRPLGDRGLRGPRGDPRGDAERGPRADRPLHRRRQRGGRRHHRPARDPPDDRQGAAHGEDQTRAEARQTARGDAGMSRFEDPVVISCSISGAIANRDQCPAIPYTPEEYAAEARRAVDEGASQIHIHARTPDGTPSYEVEDFRAITEAILGEVGDVIVNYSTGAIGVPIEKRIEYLRACKPDVAALNMSSMNYAKYSKRRKDFVFKAVFENSFDTITQFLTEMNELGIQPEHECFDAGHVANLDPLLDMGLLSEPLQISLVMGVNGGIRPNARNVAFMSEQIPGGAEGPNNWQVIGVSRDQWKLLAASLNLGGNVRAGLEDNLYLPNGEMAKSNGELIAKARQMAEDVGRRAATVAEARELLGIPKRDAHEVTRREALAHPIEAAEE